MNLFAKATATVATLALLLPGAALADKGGKSGKSEVSVEAKAPAKSKSGSGKAGAPGQVCKGLKVKGKKTAAQRAAYKQCIKDAVAKRKAEKKATKVKEADSDDEAKPEVEEEAPAPAPAPVTPTA